MGTKLNDYKLYYGDSLDIMPTLPDKSVDAIICDLPYGVTSCAWDSVIPFDELWPQYKRLIKPNGAIVLFGTQPFTSALVMSNVRGYKHRWVWNKRQGGNFAVTKFMPLSVDEDVIVFTGEGERVNYFPIMKRGQLRHRGMTNSAKNGRGFGGVKAVYYESDQLFPKSILEFPVVVRSQSLHPAQKPVDLVAYLIRTYTRTGDTVLDNCMGSGTTGVAGRLTYRNFIGMERDAEYFAIAQKRIAETQPPVITEDGIFMLPEQLGMLEEAA